MAIHAERYGIEAVLGPGPHPRRLLEAMGVAHNIVRAHHNRAKCKDWAKWVEANPDANELLVWAAQLEG